MEFRLDQIIYFCQDVPRMTRFYVDVLGLSPIENPTYLPEDWQELQGHGMKLCLHRSGKPGSAPGNKNKLVFHVEDVGAARAHLIAHKVKMGVHHHWGAKEASDGRDPEGNKFQVAGPAKGAAGQ